MKPEIYQHQLKITTEVVFILLFSLFFSFLISYMVIVKLESKNSRKLYGARIEAQDDLILLERLAVLKPVIIKHLLINNLIFITISSILVFIRSKEWIQEMQESDG